MILKIKICFTFDIFNTETLWIDVKNLPRRVFEASGWKMKNNACYKKYM